MHVSCRLSARKECSEEKADQVATWQSAVWRFVCTWVARVAAPKCELKVVRFGLRGAALEVGSTVGRWRLE